MEDIEVKRLVRSSTIIVARKATLFGNVLNLRKTLKTNIDFGNFCVNN